MISAMLRDVRIHTVIGAILLSTGLGWGALLASEPLGQIFICGADGIVALIPAWDGWRATGLLAMWALMSCVMMLPCATGEIVNASWTHRRDGILPAALLFALGHLAMIAAAGAVGALLEWTLESTGIMKNGSIANSPLATGAMLAIAGLVALSSLRRQSAPIPAHSPLAQGLHHGRSRLGSCTIMICLQFVGGTMNIAWMAVLATWMLADALLPRTRQLAALIGLSLLTAASLSFAATLA